MPTAELPRLHEMISLLLEQQLSIDDQHELVVALEADAEARVTYRELLRLHVLLAAQQAPSPQLSAPTPGWLARGWEAFYGVIVQPMALGVIISGLFITTILLSLALWIVPERKLAAPVDRAASTEFVARITSTSQATFDAESDGNLKNRDLFDDDKIVLHSGLVVITYDTGTRVVLEGPATYHMAGVNGGDLRLGKLVARVNTIEAHGFAIDLPGARIVDLGTEFGVDVAADGASEVAVLTGAVDLIVPADGAGPERRVRLSGGQAASVEAASNAIVRHSEVDPQVIARYRKLADNDLTPPTEVATRNLSIHYRADNVDGQGNPGTGSTTKLVNLASPGTHDGTIVGGSGVARNQSRAGSPYEYGIVLTAAQQTHIEVNSFQIAGGTNKVASATWEFWLRADSVLAEGRGVLYGEYPGATTGAAGDTTRHFIRMNGIGGPARQVSFDEFPPHGGSATSDSGAFETATFQQLVVTKQGDSLAFYLNGAPLGGSKVNAETYSGDKITRTLLGIRGKHSESFGGQFNIIRIYDRALGPAEVRANYVAENSVRQAGG